MPSPLDSKSISKRQLAPQLERRTLARAKPQCTSRIHSNEPRDEKSCQLRLPSDLTMRELSSATFELHPERLADTPAKRVPTPVYPATCHPASIPGLPHRLCWTLTTQLERGDEISAMECERALARDRHPSARPRQPAASRISYVPGSRCIPIDPRIVPAETVPRIGIGRLPEHLD